METIGLVVGSETKTWFRCSRCHHTMMFDASAQKKEDNIIKVLRENCISYSPQKSFDVGTPIYHEDWDDVGRVTSKGKTSSGENAIWVAFEKQGTKKLIENLQIAD